MFRRLSPNTDGLTTQRIEAFSDGVFAIAITLLIIEVKVPHGDLHGKTLAQALLDLWPSYFAYVLSFVMIGIYWANHHYVFHLYERTNHVFNLINVFFLMAIAFLPFPTAVLGQHFMSADGRGAAISFYALGLLLPCIGWCAMWFYSRAAGLIDCRLSEKFVDGLSRQYLISLGFYGFSFAISFVAPLISLAISVGLTLLYLKSPPRPIYADAPVNEA
jgi:uncharacterized membrane protein